MTHQDQFLDVIDRDEAERRFRAAIRLEPLGAETVPLAAALGRVLAADVRAPLDVPGFDRSNFDGYAVRAADTFGACEEGPRELALLAEVVATAVVPRSEVEPGTALSIATGGMLPRGADAIVMLEHADLRDKSLLVQKPVTPGFGITFAGTDIAVGETILRRGDLLTSRETGVLAAVGVGEVSVWRKPRVGVISTGDEIVSPGSSIAPGQIYDSNSRIICDAIRELGGAPLELGIVRDQLEPLRRALQDALQNCDLVLLSGGTSKGAGDLAYRIVSELKDPGMIAHGVALKPGKPICLAASQGKPVVVLPGFPTSAIFTFHEFVAPVLRQLGGHPNPQRDTVEAQMAVRVNSEVGRTEYVLVGLVESAAPGPSIGRSPRRLMAFPMGTGSGSVTTFSRADGFVKIDRHHEIVPARTAVAVQLLGHGVRVADFVVIGSHCVGLDYLLGELQKQAIQTKFLAVGSTAGLEAAGDGQCDAAGIHLLDPQTGEYNTPFLDERLVLLRGYGRLQGVVHRRGDARFDAQPAVDAIRRVAGNPKCLMVNRNQGSGTRILIDRLLDGERPNGYFVQSRSHNAVAAAVAQGRADWGVAIESVAVAFGLGFLPLVEERYDFAVPRQRRDRPPVQAFAQLLVAEETRQRLGELGFRP